MGTWSSLVYGARLENEYFNKSRQFKSDSARKKKKIIFLVKYFISICI